MKNIQLVVTCEHGGNEVPDEFEDYFFDQRNVLNTHRGYDLGALDLARSIAAVQGCSLFSNTMTRLLVDCNRSLHNQSLFSEFTWPLKSALRTEIIRKYYHPYRSLVERTVETGIRSGDVVFHLSVHSFTDHFNGSMREGKLGILFDPDREQESSCAASWLSVFHSIAPEVDVRPNYPYLGIDDGFTTYLRQKHPTHYIGIELEVSQGWLREGHAKKIQELINLSLTKLKGHFQIENWN